MLIQKNKETKKVKDYLLEAEKLGVDKNSALRILKSYLASKKN